MTALAFPSVGIQKIDMRLRRAIAVSESPFTFDTQTYVHQGVRWEAEITLPLLSYSEARSVEAFLVALKGQSGTFTFGHPLHNTPNINLGSNNAASKRDTQIIGGQTSSAVSAGTYFQLGNYLYIAVEDKAQGGNALVFEPPLREDIAAGTQCDFTLPKSTWRLASNEIGWSTDQASMTEFTFACVEAL
jgi:hypothetical protein